jgi:hypothetical protein
MKRRKKWRKAKALKAANRRSYLGMIVGVGLGATLAVPVLFVIPTGSPKQMVRAQVVREASINSPPKNSLAVPTGNPTIEPDFSHSSPTDALVSPRAATPEAKADYLPISFQELSCFRFVVTERIADGTRDPVTASLKTEEQIPVHIKALDKKDVALTGFMLPVKLEGGRVKEFLLLKNQSMCCYGVPPMISEWVNVRVAGKGVKPILDEPITVCGILHIGELRENGYLTGIYQMDGDKLAMPSD